MPFSSLASYSCRSSGTLMRASRAILATVVLSTDMALCFVLLQRNLRVGIITAYGDLQA
jgi:hypothetical protein